MNELINNKKKSEILAEAISTLQYDDVITHEQIANLIKEEYPSNKYTSTISKAKSLLLKNYNKCIENIVGDGYRVVKPDDFIGVSFKHIKRGTKEIKKGFETIQYAPVKDMSEEGKSAYRRFYDRAVILNATAEGAKVEFKKLAEKNHPFMLENIKAN